MATKKFGYNADNPNYIGWVLSAKGTVVGLHANMPENGKLVSIKMKLGRYNSSNYPVVWGAVYNRSTGARLALSGSQSPTNIATGTSGLQDFTFNFNKEFISGGTPLIVGFARDSQVNKGLVFGFRSAAGGYTAVMDGTYSSPPNTYSESYRWSQVSSDSLWVEVTYSTGGEVKVWTGSAFVSKPAKVNNVAKPVKTFKNGSWVESNS